jgi:quercetin dioxygenase-like cupin family protein
MVDASVARGVDSSEVKQVYAHSLQFLAGVAVVSVLCGGSAGVTNEEPDFVRIAPAEVRWRDVPDSHGVQQAILLRDPEKPGMYVVRVKFPPHVMDAPLWHPNARYVTVLEGTWYAGTGDQFDSAKAVPLKAGSFMLHPAKAVHWDGSAGDEPVIVQILGEGPAQTIQVGGAVLLARVEKGEFEEERLKQWMATALSRPEDRALFGLEAKA